MTQDTKIREEMARMQRRVKRFSIIGGILIGIQLINFLSGKDKLPADSSAYSISYFIGYHLFLVAGIVLMILALVARGKMKKLEEEDKVDSLAGNRACSSLSDRFPFEQIAARGSNATAIMNKPHVIRK